MLHLNFHARHVCHARHVSRVTSHVSRQFGRPLASCRLRKLRRQSGSGPGALGLRYPSLPVSRQTGLPTRQGPSRPLALTSCSPAPVVPRSTAFLPACLSADWSADRHAVQVARPSRLADGQARLADGQARLADGQARLADGQARRPTDSPVAEEGRSA
ncbi:MAG: hypothetical protein KatS3mg029_0615 [Saprospiraceae bacterium]|nr:MAG: hypothetical protein KatS3mg029_0615 [Saprospiraceae bacterium]